MNRKIGLMLLLCSAISSNVLAADLSAIMTYEQAHDFTVRANGGPLTPEQEKKLADMFGRAAPQTTQMQPAASTETEATLTQKISALTPSAPPANLKVEDLNDGFKVNGQVYLDSEGRIKQYAYDILSGEVTYLVESSPGTYTVKFNRLGSDQDGVVIANAQRAGAGWSVQLATGKMLRGELMTILPKGVLISRDTAAFKYVPGTGVQNIAVPQGWVVAPFQHGNVGSTNHMLLEKVGQESTGSSAGLMGSFKALGGALGVTKNEDYALLNIKDGKLTTFNISASGKDVASYSNCRRQNSMVNRCESMTSRESLFSKTGGRNIEHYFWRTNWFNTPQGPIAVALEGNMQDVTITDLNTGKRIVGFNRTLGIHDFDAAQVADGKVIVVAQLGFESKTIDDALTFMQTAQEVPEKK
jgi:hypothetical protein